jgi:hypothetical protein
MHDAASPQPKSLQQLMQIAENIFHGLLSQKAVNYLMRMLSCLFSYITCEVEAGR